MRLALAPALLATVFALALGCASEPLGNHEPDGGGSTGAPAGSAGSGGSGGGSNSRCSAALRQAVSLVNEVAATPVEVIESSGAELTLYVDATAPEGPDTSPWVYVSLATGAKLELTDLEALASRDWDLGFKRASIRTNGGDSGPG